jgi:endoglucanase
MQPRHFELIRRAGFSHVRMPLHPFKTERAQLHNRPIFLGEFGAYDKGDMASRARYTACVAREAENRGWSWSYWQLDSDFIVYDINNDQWVEPILKALIPE